MKPNNSQQLYYLKWIVSFLGILLIFNVQSKAQSPQDYAVQVSATVYEFPPRIEFSWPSDTNANYYKVYKKEKLDNSWQNTIATLSGSATKYIDSNIIVGEAQEYKFYKKASNYSGYGYIFSGLKYPVIEARGTIILLVESSFSVPLKNELFDLELDLIGDGWRIIRHDINRNDSIPDIKNLIKAEVNNDTAVKAIFIIGHVPVPYSGIIYPDGHSNHEGAWPADIYYAELDSNWTDSLINITTASRQANHNIPGDGKFDQWRTASDVDLQIGRVDFNNMPSFPQSDTFLLKRYLNKNHNFRHGLIDVESRGLIDDNFGSLSGEAFAANGWRNFPPMIGAQQIVVSDYFSTMKSNSYLWSFGCGPGSYTGCSGIGTTTDFANDSLHSIFTMLFGSYFGDWDSPNNFLRASIASGNTLTTCWAGRPNWFFHHMALGENIGFSARLSQNNDSIYMPSNYGARFVHIALLGDPTIRMHVVKPISDLKFKKLVTNQIKLSWNVPNDSIVGYYIYRANNIFNEFDKISIIIEFDTSFVDSNPLSGNNVYMVRALKLESTSSGSYYNLSQGIIDSISSNQVSINYVPKDVSCFGGSDGGIYLQVQNGIPPYKFTWSNGDTTQNITGLSANTYIVTLIDSDQNAAKDTIIISEPSSLVLELTIINDSNNQCNGSASVFAHGGIPPYQYNWSDPDSQETESATGLCSGEYEIIVTDSNGCKIDSSASIQNILSGESVDKDSEIRIYPNPGNGLITLIVPINQKDVIWITVLDVKGKIIFEKEFRNIGEHNPLERRKLIEQIDLSTNGAGIYFLRVKSKKIISNHKLFIF